VISKCKKQKKKKDRRQMKVTSHLQKKKSKTLWINVKRDKKQQLLNMDSDGAGIFVKTQKERRLKSPNSRKTIQQNDRLSSAL